MKNIDVDGINLKAYPDISLERLSSLRIGGICKYLIVADTEEEILAAYRFSEKEGLPLFVIGNGTNCLFSDGRLDAIVLRLGKGFSKLETDNSSNIVCGGALNWDSVVSRLAGVEPGVLVFKGIPGTVGGMAMMNAGVSIGKGARVGLLDMARRLTVVDENGVQDIRVTKADYGYRQASFRGVIAKAELDINAFRPYRDVIFARPCVENLPNAGCVFRNPSEDMPAGKLIDKCGLKGYRIGGAMVSRFHANFFVNAGGATFSDMMALIEYVREKVERQFGIRLELEWKVIRTGS